MKKNYQIQRGIKVKRDQLVNNDYNPNQTTDRQQESIEESLNEYGQLTGVLVRPDPKNEGSYIIIDGEHRCKVLTEYVYVDVVHGLEEADAKKITVIMNEARGSADKIKLAELMNSLESEFGNLEDLRLGLPYDDDQLQELIDLGNVDWESYQDDINQASGYLDSEEESQEIWTTIVCKVPNEALEVINQARDLIEDEKNFHKERDIANGQLLEILCAEYLAIPNVN